MAKATPMQRSLAHLRAQGYTVEITEHWNHFSRRRNDLFGFVDILALRGAETLAIQCTSISNMSARIKKIADHENTPRLRDAGWSIWVMGWDGADLKIKDVS